MQLPAETEDVELLDTEEQKKIIDDLEREAKTMTRTWQIALAGISLIGAIIFCVMLVAQFYSPSKLEIHNDLESKTGTSYLSTAQALSAFAYILCSFYVYTRDPMIRTAAGVTTLIATGLWAFAFYQHSVTRWIYLAIPIANFAFYVLCWYADKDTQFLFDEAASLRSMTYNYKKL